MYTHTCLYTYIHIHIVLISASPADRLQTNFFLNSCRERRAGEGVRRNVKGKVIYHVFKLYLMKINITIHIIY